MAAADPKRRTTNASIAALTRWSKQDGRQGTAAARAGWRARFENEVDPHRLLSPEERYQRTERAIKAHMKRLGQRSGDARRERAIAAAT